MLKAKGTLQISQPAPGTLALIRCLIAVRSFYSWQAKALFFDGNGHFAIRGQTITSPAGRRDVGTYQAFETSTRLEVEAKVNDEASFLVDMMPGDDVPVYLGDTARPQVCADGGVGSECANLPQSVTEPGYVPWMPMVKEAHMIYSLPFCLLDAGRRSREWGLGIYLNSGRDPFQYQQSLYDGISCEVNSQKAQTLSFKVGIDKLDETGAPFPTAPVDYSSNTRNPGVIYGPTNSSDDTDQYHFSLILDDTQEEDQAADLQKKVGVYLAYITSGSIANGGTATDLRIADLYTAFYWWRLSVQNEFIFRIGRSGDPGVYTLGGAPYENGHAAVNGMQSIAGAGRIEYLISSEAGTLRPSSAVRKRAAHSIFTDYAYAPGDADGYYSEASGPLGIENRKASTSAMRFSENYKQGLIMFRRQPANVQSYVDGVFDSSRMMNTMVLSLGYRFQDRLIGNFETRVVTGQLVEGMPAAVHNIYAQRTTPYPVGYYGTDLGYEFDFSYGLDLRENMEVGTQLAALVPGSAWRISQTRPSNSYMIEIYTAFRF